MRSVITRLTGRFISGFTGMLVISVGIEVLDKTGSLKTRLQETWSKEREVVVFVALLGGVANICAELAHRLSRRLYHSVRKGDKA